MEIERRRFKRYVVAENGYEVFSREIKLNGKLKDISEGGLSYQYTPIIGGGSTSEAIDVLDKGLDSFCLTGLNCERIYDITDLATNRSFKGTEIRLRGLEYVILSEEQKQKLESLLDKMRNLVNG